MKTDDHKQRRDHKYTGFLIRSHTYTYNIAVPGHSRDTPGYHGYGILTNHWITELPWCILKTNLAKPFYSLPWSTNMRTIDNLVYLIGLRDNQG